MFRPGNGIIYGAKDKKLINAENAVERATSGIDETEGDELHGAQARRMSAIYSPAAPLDYNAPEIPLSTHHRGKATIGRHEQHGSE